MAIRTSTGNKSYDYHRMKADQHWEMAGLARHDSDTADEKIHTEKAREHERLAQKSR